MKKNKLFFSITILALFAAGNVSAHVTVKPGEAGVGSFQTFNISVPSERDQATTRIRLILPEVLGHVTPTVKPGWRVEVSGQDMTAVQEGDEMEHGAREIIWSGGTIPGHFRDDFSFSAQVPTTPTTLVWKAHQTYSDGSVVEWDLGPNDQQPKNAEGGSDFSKKGPYSQTKVVDDLSNQPPVSLDEEDTLKTPSTTPLITSLLAFIFSLAAIIISTRKK
ncbi:MAG TPA: YcnI family protein [Verrucomicrobiae bacterium]|nr:YcnI family protein [Verrucomicrobiae bacterium]